LYKNVLFIVESYFRNPQPNGICAKVVVDELTRQGHKVKVYTSKRGYKQPTSEIVDDVQVLRYNRSIAYILRNASEYYNGLGSVILGIFSKILFGISDVLKCFIWPLNSFLLVLKYVIAAEKNLKNEKIDTIVGVYLHIEEVLAAIIIKMKNPEIKLIIYTLDAMTGRIAPKIFGTDKIRKASIKRWEDFAYKKADSICVMESHRNHYKDTHYDNIREKIKYMDIPLFKIEREVKSNNIMDRKEKIIVYTGFTSETVHSPVYFFELLKNIKNVQVHMYGTVTDGIKKIIRENGLENRIVFLKGRRKREEIVRIQQEADFLVNFGCDSFTSIPSKIFEYFSVKKPIISFYKIADDASYPYIKKYPNSLLIKEDMKLLDENVQLFSDFIFKDVFDVIDESSLIDLYIDNTPIPIVNEILD
jgi:glycosyltransferase involved in cell wall biosynthesis